METNFLKNPKISKKSGPISLGSNFTSIDENQNPVFCFKHLHKSYNIKECLSCENKFTKGLLGKIETLTQMSWTEIQLSGRRGHGSEKISRESLKKELPTTITKDVRDLLSFYFTGDKGRIIGYRGSHNIFHIVFIDTDLSVYDH